MAEAIDGTASPEYIRTKVQNAASELEDIIAATAALHQKFEDNDWSGLDDLTQNRRELDEARDDLDEIARKVGLSSSVGAAYQQNKKVGNKASLGRT